MTIQKREGAHTEVVTKFILRLKVCAGRQATMWTVWDQWEVQGLPFSSFPRLNKLKMVNKLAAYNLCLSPGRARKLLYFLISGMQFLLSQHCFVVKRVKAACSGTTVTCPAAQLHLELIMWIFNLYFLYMLTTLERMACFSLSCSLYHPHASGLWFQ